MLVALGFGMVAVFMALILTRRLTPVVALILVPLVFAVLAGSGAGVGDAVMDQVGEFAPTAALLFFAIVYFGLMIDVGLFDPLIRFILRICGNSPVRVVVGSAVLAALVSLDGDGSTTFIITVSAMLPLYLRLGLSPVVLTVVANLAAGVMNIIPWGGPTVRAATALGVSPSELFNPMVPSMLAGMVAVIAMAWLLGLSEKRRLERGGIEFALATERVRDRELAGTGGRGGNARSTGPGGAAGAAGATAAGGSSGSGGSGDEDGMTRGALDPTRPTLRPRLIWFNAALTVALLVLLGMDVVPLPFLFMVASALALLVNFPNPAQQVERIKEHSSSIVAVVSMVFAAAVLTAVLSSSGMDTAMATWLVDVVPDAWGPHLAVITGVLSMPLTFFLSNDAFYFGVLPILSQAAAEYGIAPVEMARASIVGQPVHFTSPLVPAMLLLISLAKVDLADHHRKVIWRSVVLSLVMLAAAVATGVVPLG
ncbi:CitMHS family transporter [Kineococcus sp. SYSU DK002]|uniref:CitMHS family transporter n=1 Tax=Kineococcus sp. SYSU DK002 TaxID=3383123 RepID=UPI003D7C9A60